MVIYSYNKGLLHVCMAHIIIITLVPLLVTRVYYFNEMGRSSLYENVHAPKNYPLYIMV